MTTVKQKRRPLIYFLFSSQAWSAKLLLILSPMYFYIQTSGSFEFWERIANISIALFLVLIALFILWKEYQRQDKYSKEQSEKIVEMAKRTAQLAESSTRATENSTEAIKNMTKALDRIFNRLDNV